MRTRHQRGHIFRKGSGWYLRYYDTDAAGKRRQFCHPLAVYSDRYRNKSQVRPLAEDFLRPLNEGRAGPLSIMPVAQYVEAYYFPEVAEKKRLRPSTLTEYRRMWDAYLNARLATIRLRDFSCPDGERLLEEIGQKYRLSRNSFYHIKSFMSGVFKHAKRKGILDVPNPMQDVSIPACAPTADTYACQLEEIQRMLAELPEPARTVVATAAFTGLRKSELRGLRLEDYRDGALYVARSVWRCHVHEPKTERSKAAVPVISLLAAMLDAHKRGLRARPLFRGVCGRPLNLDSLARRVVIPVLKLSGIKWHGWHAFRRGLATNLHRLGVDDKTIQEILRHSSLATTQEIYIKTVSPASAAAMRKLEAALERRVH